MRNKALFCEELKRNFVLDQLREKGIMRSQEGKNIEDCDFNELTYELVIAAFREIDIQSDANKWY